MEKVSSQNKYINKEKEDSKYLKAIENYKYSQNSKVEKFKNLDEWLEKESYLYKKEVKDKRSRYIHLKRGTIIKVDFGINLGSELCHIHFAIVLSKYDNIKQDTITVIPLTSKSGVGRVPLNNLIKSELLNYIKKKELLDDNKAEITKILNEYKKYKEFSYAYISQITTISKSRLIYSKNKFDIINKVRCSREILNKIDDAVIENITGKNIIKLVEKEEFLIKS